jgi:hypothetical protein
LNSCVFLELSFEITNMLLQLTRRFTAEPMSKSGVSQSKQIR